MLLIDITLGARDEAKEKELKDINDWLLTQIAPRCFDDEDPANIMSVQERVFNETCSILEELGVQTPENLTAYKFYTKIRYFQKKNRKQKEASENGKLHGKR